MIHALFFLLYAAIAAAAFAVFAAGSQRVKVWHGVKVFGEFIGIGLILAWVCYFLPW